MLKIKLKRFGRKNFPIYRIIVATTKKIGKNIKTLGFYNPFKKIFFCNIKLLNYYLKNGAYPTTTIRHLIYKFLILK